MEFKNDDQDSEFHLFFGRIEGTINCFRDLMTFKSTKSSTQMDVLKSSMRSIWKLIDLTRSPFSNWLLGKIGLKTNKTPHLGVTIFIVMITGKPTNLRTNRRQGVANRKSSR